MVAKQKDFWDRVFDFSAQMAAASLAVVALLFLITYEFYNSNYVSDAYKWLEFAHIGIASTICFSASSIVGLIQRFPLLSLRLRKITPYGISIAFILGCMFLLYLLIVLLIETSAL